MAGLLLGALSGLAGYTEGKANKRKEDATAAEQARQDAMTQAQIDERGRVDAADEARAEATAKTAAANNTANALANGVDPDTGKPLAPLPVPSGLSKYGKDPASESERYTRLATYAATHGRPDLAQTYQKAADSLALDADRTSTAAYRSGAETNLTNARTGLVQAQAAAERDLPARARAIAQGRDAATLQRAAMEVQGRQELAQYNGNVRAGLVQLAAAYRAQGQSADNAVKLAIADYNGQVRQYLPKNSAQAQALGTADPNAPSPSMSADLAPIMAAIAGRPQGATNITIQFDPNTGKPTFSKAGAPAASAANAPRVAPLPVGGASSRGGTPNPKSDVRTLSLSISKLRAAGWTDTQIRAASVQHGYDPQTVDQALRAASPSPVPADSAPEPRPVIQGIAPQLLGR